MRVLVTGSKGQLGYEIREASIESNDTFLFTDVVELDICDLEKLELFCRTNKTDLIVNCAAYTNVD